MEWLIENEIIIFGADLSELAETNAGSQGTYDKIHRL
jgi:hypothetical protein